MAPRPSEDMGGDTPPAPEKPAYEVCAHERARSLQPSPATAFQKPQPQPPLVQPPPATAGEYCPRVDYDAGESVLRVSAARPHLLSEVLRGLSREHLRATFLVLSSEGAVGHLVARVAAGASRAEDGALRQATEALEELLAAPCQQERAVVQVEGEKAFGFPFSCGRAASAGGLAIEQAHVSTSGQRAEAVLCVSYRRGKGMPEALQLCRQRLLQHLVDSHPSVALSTEVLSAPPPPEPGALAAPPAREARGAGGAGAAVEVEVTAAGLVRLACADGAEAACDAAGILASAGLPVVEARLACAAGRLHLHARLDLAAAPALALPDPAARAWLQHALAAALAPAPFVPHTPAQSPIGRSRGHFAGGAPPHPPPALARPHPSPGGAGGAAPPGAAGADAATRLEFVAESRNYEYFYAAVTAALCRTGLALQHCRVIAMPAARFEAVIWCLERGGGPVLDDARLCSVNDALLAAIAANN